MNKKFYYPEMGNILVFGAGGYMGLFYLKIMINLGFKQEQIMAVDVAIKLDEVKKNYPNIHTCVFTSKKKLASYKAEQALVLVNTPNHLKVLQLCNTLGIKNVFCEKPLVYSPKELNEIEKLKFEQFYIGYLINGSEIVSELNNFISEKNLAVSHAYSNWGKNWNSVPRVMGGDAEEELTHPLALITSVVNSANNLRSSSFVKFHCTYNPYVQPNLLEKAKNLDIAYPNKLNDSTSGVLEMETENGIVFAHMTSSFNAFEQMRRVEFILVDKNDSTNKFPTYKVCLEFDEIFKNSLLRADRIRIIEAKTDKPVFEFISHGNKLENQIKNVFAALHGKQVDKTLVDLKHASDLVHLLDGALNE